MIGGVEKSNIGQNRPPAKLIFKSVSPLLLPLTIRTKEKQARQLTGVDSDLSATLPTTGIHQDPKIANIEAQWGELGWRGEAMKAKIATAVLCSSLPKTEGVGGKNHNLTLSDASLNALLLCRSRCAPIIFLWHL